jgi:hypothetical protein
VQLAPTQAAHVWVLVLQKGRPAAFAQSPSATHWTQVFVLVLHAGRAGLPVQLALPRHCTQ